MAIPKLAPPLPETVRSSSGTYRRASLRRVLTHPDPILSRPAYEVADPTAPAVVEVARELIATMRASPACTGLAAPQIGESVRVFCIDVTGHRKTRSCHGLVVLANPTILVRAGNVIMREGCLSVPDLTGDVARAAEVTIEGVDPESGRIVRFDADAMEARCALHEIDHLDGFLFVERVLDPTADLFVRKRYA